MFCQTNWEQHEAGVGNPDSQEEPEQEHPHTAQSVQGTWLLSGGSGEGCPAMGKGWGKDAKKGLCLNWKCFNTFLDGQKVSWLFLFKKTPTNACKHVHAGEWAHTWSWSCLLSTQSKVTCGIHYLEQGCCLFRKARCGCIPPSEITPYASPISR